MRQDGIYSGFRDWKMCVALLLTFLTAMTVSSCGGGKSDPPMSISFAAAPLGPPTSLALSQITNFAAVVTGDSNGQGVNWAVSCTPANAPHAGCGTITPHTASGYPTTYTAPYDFDKKTIPIGGTVTIMASSAADPTKSVTATIQITTVPTITVGFNESPPASMLTGATANLVVVVQNDASNAGDDLSLDCGSPGACGTIVPAHTDGTIGSFAVYTAPDLVPTGGTVTISASSTTNPSQSVAAVVALKQAPLTISITQMPTPNLPVGGATNVAALVTFDPNNAGVDWSSSCQSPSCGSFNPSHTASGQLTTYTAPSGVPLGSVVTIAASSTTTPTTTSTTSITITPASLRNDLLNGRYAFLLQGVREGGPWAIAGELSADGIGNISTAIESLPGDNTSYFLSGTYYITGNGTGAITLNGAPTGLGYWHNGQQTFQISLVSPQLILMQEFDGYYDPNLHVAYGGTITGTLLQQSTSNFKPLASLSSYSLLMSDTGVQGNPAFYGGVLNGNSHAFTMDRSIAGSIDSISGQATFSNISTDGSSGNMLMGPYSFRYYIVDSGHWILIAAAGSTDLPAGHLYLQPSAGASTQGTFAFIESGASPTAQAGSLPLAIGGIFSSDAQGTVLGTFDGNINGTTSNTQVSGKLSVSSNGRGTLTVTGGPAQQFAVYPTATHGVLLLQLDPLSSGVGTALAQTTGSNASAALFSGSYAAAFQALGPINGNNGGVGAWNDFSGLLTSDGVSAFSGTMALDQFDESSQAFWTQTPNTPLTGNFTTGPQGRFAGTLSLPPLTSSQQVFYVLDSSTILCLGLDAAPSTGTLQVQQF